MISLKELGWDPLVNGKHMDVLKPKITFEEILQSIDPHSYTKEELRRIVQGKNLIKLVAEAVAVTDAEKKVLGHLTSICAEENGGLTIYRKLDYIGYELELKKGSINVMFQPGQLCAAGNFLGHKMRDGIIYVSGNVGKNLGHLMEGGVISVDGSAISLGLVLGGSIDVRQVISSASDLPYKSDVYVGPARTNVNFHAFCFAKHFDSSASLDDVWAEREVCHGVLAK